VMCVDSAGLGSAYRAVAARERKHALGASGSGPDAGHVKRAIRRPCAFGFSSALTPGRGSVSG
jgi:hypothetical protein